MQHQWLGQRIADRHARIERGIGVLEDQLGLGAKGSQFRSIGRCDIPVSERHRARCRLDQPQHQSTHC